MKIKDKILIVDDDKPNVKILKWIFNNDYTLDEAYNGCEALEKVNSFRPDIILLDIMMPDINGYEVCQQIRQDPKNNFIKIILISAKALIEERLEGYRSGADDYIVKPFVDDEMIAKIKVFSKLKRVEEINAIKTNLLTSFSHETNTPLHIVIGYLEAIEEEFGRKNPELRELVHKALDGAQLLKKLIDNALLLSDLRYGIKLELDIGSPLEVIKSMITDRKTDIEKKNIKLNINIDPQINIPADWRLLEWVLLQIFDNAIKFSKQDGNIAIAGSVDDKYHLLEIRNEGAVIDSTRLEHIFDILNLGTNNQAGGQHLSLAICREIIMLHNGNIVADNHNGCGVTIKIRLPLNI